MSDKPSFTACRTCLKEWETIEEFVLDGEIKVEGFLPDFGRPELSTYMLRHVTTECKAAMQLQAGRLIGLYDRLKHQQLLLMSSECQGKCLDYRNLDPCKAKCIMSWTRDIMQCLRTHSLPSASGAECLMDRAQS